MQAPHDCVIGSTVYKLYMRWGVPRLFRYADQGQWDKIVDRARRYPAETKFVHKYAPADTALHRLVRPLHVRGPEDEGKQSSTEDPSEDAQLREEDPGVTELLLNAVRAILQVNPSAASVPNIFGRTPLHLACMHITPARAKAAQVLLNSCPMTARLRDQQGRTPLHYLLMNESSVIPAELLMTLLESDPHALERCDAQGRTAIDFVRRDDGNDTKAAPLISILKPAASHARVVAPVVGVEND